MINDSEICASYRNAMNKPAQIGILAELNATTPVKVRDILEQNGFIVDSFTSADTTEAPKIRKKWSKELVEEVARLWGEGTTFDELAQQYKTTISAIVGEHQRHKPLFEHYAKAFAAQPIVEATTKGESATQHPAPLLEEILPPTFPVHDEKRFKPFVATSTAKLASVSLVISHARSVLQSAVDALKDGRSVDCAFSLGELSQVLIRAKETITQL